MTLFEKEQVDRLKAGKATLYRFIICMILVPLFVGVSVKERSATGENWVEI